VPELTVGRWSNPDSLRQNKGYRLLAPSKRPAWLRLDRLLGEWGIPKDSPAGRQRLEQALEERRGAEECDEFQPIRRGWCLGEETFREQLLTQMSERMGAEHYGEERAETAEALAELIIAEELKLGRWQEAELKTRPKWGFSEVGFSGALASGDDDDGGVDHRTSGDGHAQLSHPSLVSPGEAGRGVANIKN
jgi:hypothetical protein